MGAVTVQRILLVGLTVRSRLAHDTHISITYIARKCNRLHLNFSILALAALLPVRVQTLSNLLPVNCAILTNLLVATSFSVVSPAEKDNSVLCLL